MFDILLPILREKLVWIPFYIFIVSFILFNFGKRGYYLVLFMFLTVGTADICSSHILKKSIQRLRPCNQVETFVHINVRARCGSGYSFTSSHATNHFAIAWFLIFTLGRRIKRIRWPLFFWALSISISQIYVGVHFPFDILCGTILGTFISYLGSRLFIQYEDRWSENRTYV